MPSSEESTNNSLILNDDDKKHKSEGLEYVENTRRNSNEIRKNVKSSGNEVTNADSEIEIYTDVESADRAPIANADANTPRSDPTTGANPGNESGVNDSSNHDSFSDTNNANSNSPEGDDPENKSANKNNSLEETGDRYIKTMRRDNQGRSLDQESDNISSQKKFMSGSEGSSESLESEINICISDAKLEDLQQKKSLKDRMKKWLGYHRRMSQREFKKQIQILYKCCLKSVRDLHELHLRRTAVICFISLVYCGFIYSISAL